MSYLARALGVPVFLLVLNSFGSKGAFRFSGATWVHFRCKVEPSPGHIRCRMLEEKPWRRGDVKSITVLTFLV